MMQEMEMETIEKTITIGFNLISTGKPRLPEKSPFITM